MSKAWLASTIIASAWGGMFERERQSNREGSTFLEPSYLQPFCSTGSRTELSYPRLFPTALISASSSGDATWSLVRYQYLRRALLINSYFS
eukprot:jgi/Botrbrau1/2323/Bobra.39_1s0012.1